MEEKRKKLEYAVALGGGGTKGAYQVGVAKALKELRTFNDVAKKRGLTLNQMLNA